MSFMAFRSAGAPYKAPQRRIGDGEAIQLDLPDDWTAYDFLPTARELGQAVRKRETKAQAILARLRLGPAGTMELAQVGGVRFGARVAELRKQGYRIVTEEHAEYAIYTLEEGA
jgi:hypothetical protein